MKKDLGCKKLNTRYAESFGCLPIQECEKSRKELNKALRLLECTQKRNEEESLPSTKELMNLCEDTRLRTKGTIIQRIFEQKDRLNQEINATKITLENATFNNLILTEVVTFAHLHASELVTLSWYSLQSFFSRDPMNKSPFSEQADLRLAWRRVCLESRKMFGEHVRYLKGLHASSNCFDEGDGFIIRY